ncbi:sugar transferase [Microbacterium sp. zg.Y1090]|uniref:sugar transferase n=1 Tax=Microbacterium TaxID=33882 RepID=UPI00214BE428|nr:MULTISPECIES: sugar transferase [unclassified Microbacterium]MCR2814106.1 sugar transferase [Microbacterium sp. zg.Y1084]MCR2817889.1 sugar transferase [Microbacterium sp. zg.Y1090]WIM27942.1 sugar transferase [Microbacterium sp. zg-Y1090]
MSGATVSLGAATAPLGDVTTSLGGGTAVNAPRFLPLLERRLTVVRRRRAIGAAVDVAAILSSTALALAVMPPFGAAGVVALVQAGVFAAVWIVGLLVARGAGARRDAGRRFGVIAAAQSAAAALALVAITTAAMGWPMVPQLALVAAPAGITGLVGARAVRLVVRLRRRDNAELAPRTLIVGDRDAVEHTIRSLRMDPRLQHHVVGTALRETDSSVLTVDGLTYPVLGSPGQAADIARELCVETVIVAGATDDPDFTRRLSWSLEGAATDLVFATRLTDVVRSRISVERTHGLALTRVRLPRFDHSRMSAKRALDVAVALVALVPIALITPIIALLITMDTPGGVFFRQQRIGRDGREFGILKFRTMRATAETEREELIGHNEGAGPLFKMKADPRVTRVGKVLRRFSLDELPQFWNVLMGEMSVVGPRPPLPDEVRGYDRAVLRRLYVQPGITGLWQVSGRSDLSWDESVRLDLHYVENWSLATDLRIIMRTAAVMVRPQGAY